MTDLLTAALPYVLIPLGAVSVALLLLLELARLVRDLEDRRPRDTHDEREAQAVLYPRHRLGIDVAPCAAARRLGSPRGRGRA